MLPEKFDRVPRFIEVFNQLSKFAKTSSTDVFKVDCFLCDCLDRVVVEPVNNFLQIWQFGKDFEDSISIITNVFQILYGIQALVDPIGIQ